MMARLGNVIYWLSSLLAALFAVLGIAIYFEDGFALHNSTPMFFAVALYAFGRAVRYILAGR
jgi:hypothetical protein